jgi:hypothetical protein
MLQDDGPWKHEANENKIQAQKSHFLWFYLYETLIEKSIEMENRLLVASLGGGGNWMWLLKGYRISLWDDENVLEPS